ncbi:aminotransferase class I/II-fold pyridoxal phosphate-dependent enzyme [Pseudoflavonifractor phocaeensis]|uniref:pyridoxal phosphate-dependent aminotransferase n=1 Tax=Pseudoflavonifractor phocaeensis TaxID=1870988 RepID=UPI0025A3AC7A|nr:aminotransferase class I/II-fold pyridoxal phosphate-dependent enzyme [Pseudoflavonifractor phocaeensis]MDM8238826.1 aminotransferase class I/II-fold pyridoxal phosphate-dependent enzyme [Pseudoflavonifractor phocaeensis]
MEQIAHGGDVYGDNAGLLDFSVCLNPAGAPQAVLEAAQEGVLRQGYPDPQCRGLVRATAQRDGVEEDMVLWGNGCADLIDRFVLSLRPGKALLLAPTFGEYRRSLEGVGCQIEECFLSQEDGFLPDEALLEAIVPGVDLVFLCDPNNPTGRLIDEGLLYRVLARCRQVGAMLAVDQCFLELTAARPDRLTDQLAGGSLILFRALTKSYALAGLRLGYCLCGDRALLEKMAHILQPWPVSIPAQMAGECALQSFSRWPFDQFPNIVRERERLKATLETLGLWVCPSESCFLLFRGPENLGARLREKGILVRDCSNYSGLGPGWYRVGLRAPEENGRLIAALQTLLRGE